MKPKPIANIKKSAGKMIAQILFIVAAKINRRAKTTSATPVIVSPFSLSIVNQIWIIIL
ncbi:MAG TPA: hypothetical protein VJ697_09090 [Nitrososphaeraceae archaeon]|nr:hypothetical protein [Nitrososphaeraceae archaeon]